MRTEHALNQLKALEPSIVEKTYSGKRGCMCGCLGKYTDGLNARVLSNMKAMLENGEADDVEVTPDYIYADNGRRAYCIYLKEVRA